MEKEALKLWNFAGHWKIEGMKWQNGTDELRVGLTFQYPCDGGSRNCRSLIPNSHPLQHSLGSQCPCDATSKGLGWGGEKGCKLGWEHGKNWMVYENKNKWKWVFLLLEVFPLLAISDAISATHWRNYSDFWEFHRYGGKGITPKHPSKRRSPTCRDGQSPSYLDRIPNLIGQVVWTHTFRKSLRQEDRLQERNRNGAQSPGIHKNRNICLHPHSWDIPDWKLSSFHSFFSFHQTESIFKKISLHCTAKSSLTHTIKQMVCFQRTVVTHHEYVP